MADMKKATKTVSTATKTVAKNVKPAPQAAAEVAVNAKKEAAVKVDTKKAPEKKEEVKKAPAAAKAPAKEPVAKKAPAKKAPAKKASAKKAPAKKAAAKKVETVQEVYFQYQGGEIMAQDVVSKIEEAYKAAGHRVSAIKTLRVYIKPEENRAYYVINDQGDENTFVEL